jgi:hypothetical protein
MQFTIVDPPDQLQQTGGALLLTSTKATPQNLSRFDEMVFRAKLGSGSPPLPSTSQMFVQLDCSTVAADDGTMPGSLFLGQTVSFPPDWQLLRLAMADFISQTWEPTHPLGGPRACLESVDSIAFSVNPMLPDGQSATGRLDIDDIYFQ